MLRAPSKSSAHFSVAASHDRAQRVSAIKRAVIDLGRGAKLPESLAQLTGGRISHQHVVHRANCLCLSLLLNIAGELGQILSRCHMRRGRPDVAGLHEPEGEITLQGGAQGDIVVGLARACSSSWWAAVQLCRPLVVSAADEGPRPVVRLVATA